MDLARLIVATIASVSALYQCAAILACVLFQRARLPRVVSGPVSILKPLKGVDRSLREAIESHLALEGEFELLGGVRADDPDAARALAEFPKVRVVTCRTETVNGKVGSLHDLAGAARHEILIQNDADIRVPRDYIARVAGPLTDPSVAFVTCLYRPVGTSFAGCFEGLGTVTDFAPSALVGRMIGVDDLAVGATMAFRRVDLERIGGFLAFGDYLADDFQLGSRLRKLGGRGVISDVVVETELGGSWTDVWKHQIRWTRTLRVSNGPGYMGLFVTFTAFWALAAYASGYAWIGVAAFAARMSMALISGWGVMRSRDVLRYWYLIPVRDLFAAAIWACGLFGDSVEWRGRRFKLKRGGEIVTIP